MKKSAGLALILLFFFAGFCGAETHRITPRSQMSVQESIDFSQPGDTIILEEGIYEVDEALTITDTDGIILQGEGEVWILCSDVYANVISVTNSHNIHIYGIKARHKEWVPEYTCNGSVLYVANATAVEVLDCEFNGCGAFGIYLDYVEGADISYCYLHHNSFSALYFNHSSDIFLTFNRIMDNASFVSALRFGNMECLHRIYRNVRKCHSKQ